MTQFDKEKFHYHGGYLTYHGTYEGHPHMMKYMVRIKFILHVLVCPVELFFVARFKYVFFQGSFKNFWLKTSQLKNMLHDIRMVNHH